MYSTYSLKAFFHKTNTYLVFSLRYGVQLTYTPVAWYQNGVGNYTQRWRLRFLVIYSPAVAAITLAKDTTPVIPFD